MRMSNMIILVLIIVTGCAAVNSEYTATSNETKLILYDNNYLYHRGDSQLINKKVCDYVNQIAKKKKKENDISNEFNIKEKKYTFSSVK